MTERPDTAPSECETQFTAEDFEGTALDPKYVGRTRIHVDPTFPAMRGEPTHLPKPAPVLTQKIVDCFNVLEGIPFDPCPPGVTSHEPKPPLPEDKNILLEAYEITGGDRQNDYGTPEQNWERIASIASALTEKRLTAEDCLKVLIATKLARTVTSPQKRDNYVDLAGYAHCLWEVMKP